MKIVIEDDSDGLGDITLDVGARSVNCQGAYNGVGFEMGPPTPQEGVDRGLGLASMKERTELSSGRFLIESRPGVGTTILAPWECT